MLDLNFNISLDVKRIKQPIHFEKKNCCVHCGANGSLVFVNKFNKESDKEIHPFNHIKCRKCGHLYSIKWQPNPDNNSMYPSAVDYSIRQEFKNIVDYTMNQIG